MSLSPVTTREPAAVVLRQEAVSPTPLNRLVVALSAATPALLAYALVRAIALVAFFHWSDAAHRDGVSQLERRFDAVWFVDIAEHGYDHGPTDAAKGLKSNLAMFPLYPMLIRAIGAVTPLPLPRVGLILAWLAALAAAWAMFAIGNHLHGPRTGVLLAALWGALPHAHVESMAYSESLFTALAAWALYAVLTHSWLIAGALAAVAGLSRATAAAIIGTVMAAAVVAALRRRAGWRPWAAAALAPLGLVGYLAWVGVRTGRPDGYVHVHSTGWQSGFDAGAYTLRYVITALQAEASLTVVMVTIVLLAALTLFALSVLDRQPWPLLLYSGLFLAITIGESGFYWAKGRFLLPAFTLLLPIAVGLARTRVTRALVVLAALTAVSAYYGGYLFFVWKYSP
jgi:hypothetical protein